MTGETCPSVLLERLANTSKRTSSPPATTQPTRSEGNILQSTERIFGKDNYLSYGWIDANWTEHEAQTRVFKELERLILDPNAEISGRALFEMAIAHAIGFGTHENHTTALKSILKSASKGYLPARAIFYMWHQAHRIDILVDLEVQVDWLYEATTWGSFYASKGLEQINQEEHLLARREFHARGGYNQFFYPREPPSYIGSQEFRNSISSLRLVGDLSHAHTLLISAAVYGDEQLADRLIEVTGIDPNFTNEYGESLMVVACKGGNLPVVRVNPNSSFCVLCLTKPQLLANHGATTSIYDREKVLRQPTLHWLVVTYYSALSNKVKYIIIFYETK